MDDTFDVIVIGVERLAQVPVSGPLLVGQQPCPAGARAAHAFLLDRGHPEPERGVS